MQLFHVPCENIFGECVMVDFCATRYSRTPTELHVDINHWMHDFTLAFVIAVDDAMTKCIYVVKCSVSRNIIVTVVNFSWPLQDLQNYRIWPTNANSCILPRISLLTFIHYNPNSSISYKVQPANDRNFYNFIFVLLYLQFFFFCPGTQFPRT